MPSPRTPRSAYVRVTGIRKCSGPFGGTFRDSLINTKTSVYKESEVRLGIVVQHAAHSKLIGKEGANGKSIQKRARIHLHFPDGNLTVEPGQGGYSNTVWLNSVVENVKQAIPLVRAEVPITIEFRIDKAFFSASLILLKHSELFIKRQLALEYTWTERTLDEKRVVELSFTINEEKNAQEALAVLIGLITSPIPEQSKPLLRSVVDHIEKEGEPAEKTICGPDSAHLRQIEQLTGASVWWTNSLDNPDERTIYFVSKDVARIFEARKLLIGYYPIVLKFDNHHGDTLDELLAFGAGVGLGVGISIEEKKSAAGKETQFEDYYKEIVIRTIESNIENAFKTRAQVKAKPSTTRDWLQQQASIAAEAQYSSIFAPSSDAFGVNVFGVDVIGVPPPRLSTAASPDLVAIPIPVKSRPVEAAVCNHVFPPPASPLLPFWG